MAIRVVPSRIAVALAAALLASSGTAAAQLKGHYIPGFTGLGNGTQPPPGVSIALPIFVYPTDTIKDDHGDPLGVHPNITASFIGAGVGIVTNTKVLGARYGAQVIPLAWMKSRIEGNSLDVPGSFGFTDIYVQPLWLGWETPRADYVAGWGFFTPTGTWELGGTDNAGLGMWSHDFQLGTTVRLDKKRAWSTSGLLTWEIHSQKKDTDVKVGSIVTLEGGTGRAFYKPVQGSPIPRIITIGIAYYTQFKATADSGTTFQPLNVRLAHDKDRVFGIGGEASVFLPKAKLLFDARIIPEFGARDRTQGLTMLFTIGYQVKSLVKAGKP